MAGYWPALHSASDVRQFGLAMLRVRADDKKLVTRKRRNS
jgi:hypothetical protein